jgi:hypothetical protein
LTSPGLLSMESTVTACAAETGAANSSKATSASSLPGLSTRALKQVDAG